MRRADIAIVAVDAGPASGLLSQQTASMTAECEVYAWALSDKLPVIPIPLKPRDADASVPLQEVFDIVYQRARYGLSVRDAAPLDPPITSDELRWVQSPLSQS